jgi:FlaA1/EpsC-like NDP-sugar epimerase
VTEVVVAAVAYLSSVVLFSQAHDAPRERGLLGFTMAAVGCALVATLSVRLFRRSLHHANLLDIGTLVQAVALNGIGLATFMYWRGSVLRDLAPLVVLNGELLFLFWSFLHFGPRVWRAQRAAQRKHGVRVVIVGAGDAGLSLMKEIALDPESPFRAVALADDDSRKWGRTLYGVPVLGGTQALAKIASERAADEILVCVPSATHSQMHHILDACRRLNLPVRSLPSLAELIERAANKKITPRDLRGPRIEYLLQRDEFHLDTGATRQLVEGKVVLVTGAGGSIGSELARQIAAANPAKLLLLDKSENSLFYAHLEISERLGSERAKPLLVDLSAKGRVRKILKDERPELIFHAAAHKHVSMIELHPEEAIRNNVLGTRNLAEAALEFGAAAFVNISTDKAVDPQNFMGLSKKLTELCIQEFARQACANGLASRFSNVRFGNVAGSTGSVIRLFWEQIQHGGPLRVTDPQASRYFMSISEAVHLILGAADLGRSGETFVFEMGEPINIYELAKTMALFSGLRPQQDIAIEFIGLRKGEKLNEQLWDEWEHPVPTPARHILAIREENSQARGIVKAIREMEQLLAREDSASLLSFIGELFPAFRARTQIERASSAALPRKLKVAAMNPVEAA